ncbi:MAG: hypothetical protein Q7T80_10335, partial [Methanoregula sp.]|nr:hypothetical protein [Methanoregula sp.]
RIYTLSFVSEPSTDVKNAMNIMSKHTLGFYQHAPTESDLTALYKKIAGDLNVQAGGGTKLVADFGKITVDGSSVSNVDDYMTYVYHKGGTDFDSTLVTKYNEVPVKTIYAGYPYVRNDTRNWTGKPSTISGDAAKNLSFDVGNIVLNDVWMTNLQFNMTGGLGVIELFGPNCPVTFIDATDPTKQQTVNVPSIQMTIHKKKLVDDPFGLLVGLNVTEVLITPVTSDPNLWTVSWNTGYDSDKSVNERLLYCSETGSSPVSCAADHNLWPAFPNQPTALTGNGISTITPNSLIVDTSTLKLGETYRVTVWATESTPGGKESSGAASYQKGDGTKRVYIKLE